MDEVVDDGLVKRFKRFFWIVVSMAILVGVLVFVCQWYSYIFAKTIQGKVMAIDRGVGSDIVASPVTGTATPPPNQAYSFVVAVQDHKTGDIITASSEDRQWAVVQKGQCVEAKFLPYPPWNLTKAGYYGAMLLHIYTCP